MTFIAYLIPAIVIGASAYFSIRSFKKTGNAAQAVRVNLMVAAVLFVVCAVTPFVAQAAQVNDDTVSVSDAAEADEAAPATDPTKGLGMLGAALATGISGIGGGIAVAAGAPAAIGATSEDPKAFGKALIFVALGESIALYGLVISIMILGKY